MTGDRTTRIALAVIAAGLVLVVMSQVLAPVVMPRTATGTKAETTLGSAGFAYLTGFRTFAAAMLWNRLEPTMHKYYKDHSLDAQLFMVPAIRMVTWLNPQFTQAYFVGQWIVAKNGHVKEALALTEDGVKDNPDSGLMLASKAQMLLGFADLESAHKAARAAIAPGVKWADALEEWEELAVLRVVFKKAGDTEGVRYADARRKALDAEADKVAREQQVREQQEEKAK